MTDKIIKQEHHPVLLYGKDGRPRDWPVRRWVVLTCTTLSVYTDSDLSKKNRKDKTVTVVDVEGGLFELGEDSEMLGSKSPIHIFGRVGRRARRVLTLYIDTSLDFPLWAAALSVAFANPGSTRSSINDDGTELVRVFEDPEDEFSMVSLMGAAMMRDTLLVAAQVKAAYMALPKKEFIAVANQVVRLVCYAGGPQSSAIGTLLALGANVNSLGIDGGSALYWAASGLDADFADKAMFNLFHCNASNGNAPGPKGAPLWVAAANGHSGAVVSMVNAFKANIDTYDVCGKTALAVAIERDHKQAVAELLYCGADVDDEDSLFPPLHVAARCPVDELYVRLLLDEGADIAIRSASGETALHAVVSVAAPMSCASLVFSAVIAYDKESGVDEDYDEYDGYEDLMNAERDDGATALWVCVSAGGDNNVVANLAHHGTYVDTGNCMEQTPLFVACLGAESPESHYTLLASFLVEICSADVDEPGILVVSRSRALCDPYSFPTGTALAVPAGAQRSSYGPEFPSLQALYGHLAENSIDLDPGWTPLMLAAVHGNAKLVDILLGFDADVHATSHGGFTALLCAAGNGYRSPFPAVVKALLDANATPSPPLALTGIDPLLAAANAGCLDTIRLLVDAGANVNVFSVHAVTPLMLACKAGNVDATEILLAGGADPDGVDCAQLQWYDGGDARAWRFSRSCRIPNVLLCGGDKSPLVLAREVARRRKDSTVVDLLLAQGATEAGFISPTALHKACAARDFAAMRVLLDGGADVNAVDQDGRAAIDVVGSHVDPKLTELLGVNDEDANLAVVAALLARGAHPDGGSRHSSSLRSPLHNAAENNDIFCVFVLLLAGADCNKVDPDCGHTLLSHAFEKKNTELVGALLAAGAYATHGRSPVETLLAATLSEKSGETLMAAALAEVSGTQAVPGQSDVLLGVVNASVGDVIDGDLEVAATAVGNRPLTVLKQELAERGYRFNVVGDSVHDSSGKNTLLVTLVNSRAIYPAAVLLIRGANPSEPRLDGETPLSRAILAPNPLQVGLLVAAGANLDTIAPWRGTQQTPFCKAIYARTYRGEWARRLLINAGADVNKRCPPVPGMPIPVRRTAMQIAGEICACDTIRELAAAGADVNDVVDGKTALGIVAAIGFVDAGRVLLELGADPNGCHTHPEVQASALGRLPLQVAVLANNFVFATLLLKYGADVNAELSYGTSLSAAVVHGNIKAVKFLLNNGADIHRRQIDGEDLVDFAVGRGFHSVATLLAEHSANAARRSGAGGQ